MSKIRAPWPSAALLLALVGAGCDVRVEEGGLSLDIAEGRARDEWARTYELAQGGRLEIVNVDGGIEVFPATDGRTGVRAKREVRARSREEAQKLLAQATITEEVGANQVTIRTPDLRQLRGFMKGAHVEYRVNVPAGLDVSVKTENGGVRIENVSGRLTASATNGGIVGRGVSGSIDAAVVNGGIVVEFAALDAASRMVTVNGGVRVDVPATINATLDASAVNGGVRVAESLPLSDAERTRQRVTGRVNAGGPPLVLQTTNGGIRVGTAGGGAPRDER